MIVPVLILVGVGFFIVGSSSNMKRILSLDSRLDWSQLRYPADTPDSPSNKVKDLNNKEVTITGFMVPLVDELNETSEFLLVPYPQACIHVPAPPPDQIVHVVMQEGKTLPVDGYSPLDIHGILHLESKVNPYATAQYTMEGLGGEPFSGTYQSEYVVPFDTPCTESGDFSFSCIEWKLVSLYYEWFVLEDEPIDDLIQSSETEPDPYGPSEDILRGLPTDSGQ